MFNRRADFWKLKAILSLIMDRIMDLIHVELEIQVIMVSIDRYTFGIIQS